MREQFVPYKIALKLKEKGFDEPCLLQEGYIFSYFGESKYRFHSQLRGGPFGTDLKGKKNSDLKGELPKYKDWVLIPLWQQVFDWFEDKLNLKFSIAYWNGYNNFLPKAMQYKYEVYIIPENAPSITVRGDKGSSYFDTRKDAITAAILKALTLI